MDYMKQLNRFFEFSEAEGLPASAQLVFLHLMNINNRLHWREWFKVANSRLENLTGMTNKTIVSAKNRLKQAGLISFKSDGRVVTRYKILPITTQDSIQDSTQDSIQDTTQDSIQDSIQDTTQIKRHKTKTKDKREDAPKIPKKEYAENVLMTEEEYKKLVDYFNGREDIVQWCITTLNDYKGASGKKYTSDYYAIRKWVISEYEKKREEKLAKMPKGDDLLFANFGKGIAS